MVKNLLAVLFLQTPSPPPSLAHHSTTVTTATHPQNTPLQSNTLNPSRLEEARAGHFSTSVLSFSGFLYSFHLSSLPPIPTPSPPHSLPKGTWTQTSLCALHWALLTLLASSALSAFSTDRQPQRTGLRPPQDSSHPAAPPVPSTV